MPFLRPRRRPASRDDDASSAVAGRVVLLLVACAVCYYCLPLADARERSLRGGPPAVAYPWDGQAGLSLDPWGFVTRQCTSYVAWFLNAHGVPFGLRTRGPDGEAMFTSAGEWDRAAETAGFAVRSTAVVGSIAQWDPGESSPAAPGTPASRFERSLTALRYGHVAVVQRVLPDGAVVVAEYDGADGRFHVVVTRAPRYLYIGVPEPRAVLSAARGPGG